MPTVELCVAPGLGVGFNGLSRSSGQHPTPSGGQLRHLLGPSGGRIQRRIPLRPSAPAPLQSLSLVVFSANPVATADARRLRRASGGRIQRRFHWNGRRQLASGFRWSHSAQIPLERPTPARVGFPVVAFSADPVGTADASAHVRFPVVAFSVDPVGAADSSAHVGFPVVVFSVNVT
jgi:hypothetical protein